MPRPIPDFEVAEVLGEHDMFYSSADRSGMLAQVNDSHAEALLCPHISDDLRNIQLGNTSLKVHEYRQTIIDTIQSNSVTIIVAETGAGKSTQVPQYLADEGYSKVYITQPRRAAARNVYSRVREEIGDVLGRSAGAEMVSYQTAGEFEGTDDATISVVTDGLQLVRELHDRGFKGDDVLIIDEAHEWNSNVEVLVAWTKKAIADNPNLRVVVMSATMDAQHLAEYYSDVCPEKPPIINVPGRNFEVEKLELPNSTVVDEVIRIAMSLPDKEGQLPEGPNGILMFKPGKREIYDSIDEIRNRLPRAISGLVKIFPLHAKLSPREQQAALAEYQGSVKIVAATDVAQTSLTIPDIRFVVDSGYHRRIEVDHEGTRGLMLNPISRADRDQRAGRTGRVGDGTYILTRLNNATPHVTTEHRDEYPTPEILRSDVARNTLRLKALGLDIEEFDMYHKASGHTIDIAKNNLKLLGALDDEFEITPIGIKMDDYPLCASSARIMVEAEQYRESTRAYLAALTAAKEAGGLQYFAQNVGKKWLELTDEETSDLLVQLDIFIAIQDMTQQEIRDHDLDANNVERAREQYFKIAKIANATLDKLSPPSQEEREVIKRCIAVGYLPNTYVLQGDSYINAQNPKYNQRELSKRSLVSGKPPFIVGDPYNIELRDGEEVIIRHCIENVTAVTAQLLGSVASSQVIWQPEGYLIRDGKFRQRERQRLFDIDLGLVQEVAATPSPQLREAIIAHSIENPGAAQKELRAIKKELEVLSHLAKDSVGKLTHDRILELVDEAAPEGITTPATIEDNLRLMLLDPDRALSIDDFVSKRRRKEIISNAPSSIEIDGETLRLKYRNGIPVAKHYNRDGVLNLPVDAVVLDDGREVQFAYKKGSGRTRYCGLFDLRAKEL